MIDLGRYARIEREYVCDWKPGMPFRSEQARGPNYVALLDARGGTATIAQLANDAGVTCRKCAGRMRDLERDGKVRFVGVGSVERC